MRFCAIVLLALLTSTLEAKNHPSGSFLSGSYQISKLGKVNFQGNVAASSIEPLIPFMNNPIVNNYEPIKGEFDDLPVNFNGASFEGGYYNNVYGFSFGFVYELGARYSQKPSLILVKSAALGKMSVNNNPFQDVVVTPVASLVTSGIRSQFFGASIDKDILGDRIKDQFVLFAGAGIGMNRTELLSEQAGDDFVSNPLAIQGRIGIGININDHVQQFLSYAYRFTFSSSYRSANTYEGGLATTPTGGVYLIDERGAVVNTNFGSFGSHIWQIGFKLLLDNVEF